MAYNALIHPEPFNASAFLLIQWRSQNLLEEAGLASKARLKNFDRKPHAFNCSLKRHFLTIQMTTSAVTALFELHLL